MDEDENDYVSRGGRKLAAALEAFGLDVTGLSCADFGANVGGFTDCLLRRGAARVAAVDTGYGALDWTLRNDPRVQVLERTNALHAEPPAERVDLVTIDVAFTPQRRVVPAAARWVRPEGHIISLLKPHYEREKLPLAGPRRPGRRRGRKPPPLDRRTAGAICLRVCRALARERLAPVAAMVSPLTGKGGNVEFFLHIRPGAGPSGAVGAQRFAFS